MIYVQLFISFLKIGLFGFGGGYAMLSLIQHEVVENHAWVSARQFTDMVAVSQMTPGPIAINSATFIGYTVTGDVWGAALATLAVCIPPLTVMLLLTRFFLRFRRNRLVGAVMEGLKPMIVGMIGAAALMLMTPSNFPDRVSAALFGACLIASLCKINPIWLIAASALFGMVFL
jgi:chromate transporter